MVDTYEAYNNIIRPEKFFWLWRLGCNLEDWWTWISGSIFRCPSPYRATCTGSARKRFHLTFPQL